MELMTKCPQCGTLFSAALDQLQLRKGYIRCPNCAHIFDGYEAVVQASSPSATDAPATGSPSLGQPPVHEPIMAPASLPFRAAAPLSSAPAAAVPSVVRHRVPPAPTGSVPRVEPVVDATVYAQRPEPENGVGRPEPRLYSEPDQGGGAAHEISGIYADRHDADDIEPSVVHARETVPLPDFLRASQQRRRGVMRVFWGVLALLGLALLGAQLAYVYRLQIAGAAPTLRPLLEQACEALDCKVGYSRRIERIAIMDSSLQAAPRSGQLEPDDSVMVLRVVLRNNYNRPQAWPTLRLDLVDFSGSVVVRRRLAPADYLRADALSGPFEAGAEIRIAVPITVTGLKINGYQLGKYYPPEG